MAWALAGSLLNGGDVEFVFELNPDPLAVDLGR
jgi:hypothetical protein